MTDHVVLAGAVVAGVLVAASSLLWLDRRGAKAVLRTGAVAVAAALVTLAVAQGGEDLFEGPGESWVAGFLLAGIFMTGLAVALGLAGLAGWTDLPLDGVILGAVAGAAAALACSSALGEDSTGVMVALGVGWLGGAGAWVGGGVSLAALQPSPIGRVGAGAAVVALGWLGSGGLLAGMLAADELLPWSPALAAGGGLGALVAAAGAVIWGQRMEARILLQELTEEAGYGTLPAALVDAVAYLGSRWRRAWWPRSDERRWLAATLSELAIRKYRLRGRAGGSSGLDGLHVGRIRARVRTCFDGNSGDLDEEG